MHGKVRMERLSSSMIRSASQQAAKFIGGVKQQSSKAEMLHLLKRLRELLLMNAGGDYVCLHD